jgi:hypothetical protein
MVCGTANACPAAVSFTSIYLLPRLNKTSEQFTPVSTVEQHVPSLGDILKLGVDNLLAVLGI